MRRPKSHGKREQILEAAKRVVVREGIWNTTTRKIAEEASVNVATIHYHFEDKEALLFAVFERMIAAIRGQAREDFKEPGTLAERIERAVMISWDYTEKHWADQFLQAELTLYAVRTAGAAWLAQRQHEQFVAFYMDIFRGASDVGKRRDLDIEGLSRMVIAGIDGLLQQHFACPDAARSKYDCRQLTFLALRYPLTKGAEPLAALSLDQGTPRKSRTPRRTLR